MNRPLPHELPCLTTSQEQAHHAAGALSEYFFQLLQEASNAQGYTPMPNEELWVGGGGKSHAWLHAELARITKEHE